jgi:hypothetical protein
LAILYQPAVRICAEECRIGRPGPLLHETCSRAKRSTLINSSSLSPLAIPYTLHWTHTNCSLTGISCAFNLLFSLCSRAFALSRLLCPRLLVDRLKSSPSCFQDLKIRYHTRITVTAYWELRGPRLEDAVGLCDITISCFMTGALRCSYTN